MQTLTVLLFTFTLQKIPSQQPLTTACNVFYEGVFCKAFVSSSNRKACVCVLRIGTLLSVSSLYRGFQILAAILIKADLQENCLLKTFPASTRIKS